MHHTNIQQKRKNQKEEEEEVSRRLYLSISACVKGFIIDNTHEFLVSVLFIIFPENSSKQ